MRVDVLWPLVRNGISLLAECNRVRKLGDPLFSFNPYRLAFSIYTFSSCTYPVGILQPLLISQDQSGVAKACVGPKP
jgi:hypothetical protein